MSEHSDPFEESQQLRARVQESAVQFILTELKTGLALLDLAENTDSGNVAQRRTALAAEAYDVVSARLARTGTEAVVLSDQEREEIDQLRAELGRRLER